MLLNFNMNFMEMSLNGFLWLDLNSVFLFSNLHLKMATITHNLSQKWHPNKAVFQRKFRKIASVDYRMSIWHLPWLLSECNSPKWVARVEFAACWEILRGPLHTVDRLPRKKNKWQCQRKENMVLNSLWTFYCSTRKSTLKQRRGWFCYTFTLNDFYHLWSQLELDLQTEFILAALSCKQYSWGEMRRRKFKTQGHGVEPHICRLWTLWSVVFMEILFSVCKIAKHKKLSHYLLGGLNKTICVNSPSYTLKC